MDTIRQSLDQIQNLSADDLKSLQDSVISEFNTVKSQDPTQDVVATMGELAKAAKAIKVEQNRRVTEAAALAQQAADAQTAIDALTAPDEDDAADNADDASEADAVDANDVAGDDDADSTEEVVIAPEEDDDNALAAKSDSAPADAPADDAAPAATDAPAEGSAAEEAAETPAEESAEDLAAHKEAAEEIEGTPAEIAAETPAHKALEDAAAEKIEDAGDTAPDADAAPAEGSAAEEAAETPAEEAAEDDPEQPMDEEDKKTNVFAAESAEAPVANTAEFSTDDTTPAPEDAEDASDTNEEGNEDPVTASATTELEFEAPADRRPAARLTVPVTITAGADLPGITAGSTLPDMKAVAQAILDRKKGMGRTSGGDGEQHTVATFTTTFPEERFLSPNDVDGNRTKIDEVITASAALVAAGGSAAPVEVRYELFGLGGTTRPVRDSLAVFGADRQGIRYVTPPVLGDLNGSVSLWTLQNDIDAANGVAVSKPCLRVIAGAEVVVYTDAIPLCLTFGNFGARAYPELVERHTELGMIQHARFAETRLLTRIGSLSTAVTADKQLGAAKDILVQVEQAAAAYRNRHRMDVNDALRVIFPEWFKNAMRADLTKQIPGNGEDDTVGLADAKINSWFSVRNINVTWALDGETGQIFGAQDTGALEAFPAQVIWYLFAEGTFLFLDGGTLDLGLVRDSTLNSTNDYKIFLESFEGVAKIGVESLRITSNLAILGASSSTVVVAN